MNADEFFDDWLKRCERMAGTQETTWTDERIERLAASIVSHRAQQNRTRAAGVPLSSNGNVIDARARFAALEN